MSWLLKSDIRQEAHHTGVLYHFSDKEYFYAYVMSRKAKTVLPKKNNDSSGAGTYSFLKRVESTTTEPHRLAITSCQSKL